MEQYIPKAPVVAEIEKRIKENKVEIERATHKHLEEYFEGYEDALVLFKEKYLDTLEVKEVDLEEEIGKYLDANDIEFSHQIKLLDFAKHFFELGMQQSKNDNNNEEKK